MALTTRIFTLRPEGFGFDQETARTNVFQQDSAPAENAQREFDQMVELLQENGFKVEVWPDDPDLQAPNAVFLNNWFSTHEDGTLVLYPMLTENRKREVRPDLIGTHHVVKRIIDLTEEPKALEGTGSLVFDHLVKRAFLVPSDRSDPHLAAVLCDALGYGLVVQDVEIGGKPVYHTNVVLSVGPTRVLACDAFADQDFGDRTVIRLREDQIWAYAGNAIELGDTLVLSETAWNSLDEDQRRALGKVLVIPVPTFEVLGGGSVRCMIAENFLRPKQDARVALDRAADPH